MTVAPKLAVVQAPPVFLNREESLIRALQQIEAAANDGAHLIAFPECWIPGYPVWLDFSDKAALWDQPGAKALYRLLASNAVVRGDAVLEALQDAADRCGVHLAIGTHERDGGTLYNTSFYFSPGLDGYSWHRKLVPTYTERLVWGRGDGSSLTAFNTAFGRVGGLICWEHWMPLARAAMHAMDETVHIAQWPAVKEIHQLASRHYAIEGRCFVMAAGSILTKGDALDGLDSLGGAEAAARALLEAMPGERDALIHDGGSAIIGPDGDYLAGPLFGAAGTVSATIDRSRIDEGHLTLDTAGHYSRPDIFELHVNTRPQRGVLFQGDRDMGDDDPTGVP